jgi:hypothetical protein
MKSLLFPVLLLIGLGSCTSGRVDRTESAAGQSLIVIPLENAVAAELASTLGTLRPDTRVVADVRTNSLIVSSSSQAGLRELSDCIEELDVPVHAKK